MPIIETPPQPKKKSRGQPEMRIQSECVRWIHNEHPETRGLFFHIKNELDRPDANAMLGARLRAEGIVKGVADCALMMKRGAYGALFVEFKTDVGRQSEAQKNWERIVTMQGYYYRICRSLEQFKEIINEYLCLPH